MDTKLTLTEVELTPLVKSLKGAVKAPENFDYNYKKLIEEIRKTTNIVC